jgi:hypothetical protein
MSLAKQRIKYPYIYCSYQKKQREEKKKKNPITRFLSFEQPYKHKDKEQKPKPQYLPKHK